MDGLQQRGVVQVEVEVRGHPRRQRSLPPLILRHVNSSYQGIRDLAAKDISANQQVSLNLIITYKVQRAKRLTCSCLAFQVYTFDPSYIYATMGRN